MAGSNIVIRTSRKAFTHHYVLAMLLAFGAILSYRQQFIDLPNIAYFGAVALAIGIFSWPELHRAVNYIEIFPSQLIHNQGLLAKNQVSMIGSRIVAMHLDQHWYQRLLGYGDITIKSFNKELKVLADQPHKLIPAIKKHMNWAGED